MIILLEKALFIPKFDKIKLLARRNYCNVYCYLFILNPLPENSILLGIAEISSENVA